MRFSCFFKSFLDHILWFLRRYERTFFHHRHDASTSPFQESVQTSGECADNDGVIF